ncbi:unnamed protein product [Trichobilharzia regenti]|nr:unnamed protein product [Trichobilharzia regenti]
MAVGTSLGKRTKTPYSVAKNASARGNNNPGASATFRIPIPKTRVHFAYSDTTPASPQSYTETAQAIPRGHDTIPVSIGASA